LKEQDKHDVVGTWHYHADYSYPTPTVERDGLLAQVIPYLEQHEVYSRGRFGMWKYEVANTDHSLMQGVELINRLLLGEPEQTIGIKYESTLDGRQAAVHERSSLAGSGDPKKMKELAELAGRAAAKAHPGTVTASHTAPAVKDIAAAIAAGGPGDKIEAHTSEEELGVTTTPTSEEAAS
jgi:hypothetical protein